MTGLNEHPMRRQLAEELHARPYGAYYSPIKVSHLAAVTGEEDPSKDREHVAKLCQMMAVKPPSEKDGHFLINLGPCWLKWERHTEFSTYTFYEEEAESGAFKEPVLRHIPEDWIGRIPGQIMVATHLFVMGKAEREYTVEEIAGFFDGNTVTGSHVLGRRAEIWTDYMLQADGFTRLLIRDRALSGRQTGRLIQRMLEVETYRLLAMLAFPVARRFQPKAVEAEQKLGAIVSELSELDEMEAAKRMLKDLSTLSAELEQIRLATGYRFAAARAYYGLVTQRLSELREERMEGVQPTGEFVERRTAPAMRTCDSLSERLETLSRRTARASDLLRTQVNVALEEQNRNLLQSMDRRAHVQLRLQETVEGLSVVAISYYLVGLVLYGAKAAKGAGLPINPEIAVGIAIPAVIALVWTGVRRLRKALSKGDE
ncbi:MAG: DUF3422 family protein [Magnetovibrionaceae bacterium]